MWTVPLVASILTEHIPLIEGLIQIFLGSIGLGLAVAYAWWSVLRVTYFRQDLFAIRDRLWDEARKLDAFSDPSYRETREVLNACIAAASFVSLPQLVHSKLIDRSDRREEIKSERSEVQQAVDAAMAALTRRIGRYIMLERPISGLVFGAFLVISALAILTPIAFVKETIRAATATIDPKSLRSMATIDRRRRRRAMKFAS